MNPTRAPPRTHCRASSPRDSHLHFRTFENLILVQKTGISRTTWINPCYSSVPQSQSDLAAKELGLHHTTLLKNK